MKLFIALIMLSTVAFAKDMSKFNEALMEKVQQDIRTENDFQFKTKEIRRGPASVEAEPDGSTIKEDNKFDKMNVRQIGPEKW